MNHLRSLPSFALHTLRLVFAFLFLAPTAWMFISSLWPDFQPFSAIWGENVVPSLANYHTVGALIPLATQTANSLRVVIVAVPIALIIASLAGFALVRLPRRQQVPLLALSMLGLLAPPSLLWLVRMPLFRTLNWIDSPWALIAPAFMGGAPLFVLIFFWSFLRLSPEQFESAIIEGASEWQLWWRVALPQSRHITAAIALLLAVLFWGNYTDPLLYLRSEAQMTLAVGIQRLAQLDANRWPVKMAGAVIFTLPVLIFFILAQRSFWKTWQGSENEKR